ncbi:MAG: signal transduction histidine kinase with CheB and CheR [Verrucomicrobiales bacterium]|nr:signal transduction histidine kinase with CheB and CheR [Verrucomicrobiales bacterium]
MSESGSANTPSPDGDTHEARPLPGPPPLPADHAEEILGDRIDNSVPAHGYHRRRVVGLGGSAGSLQALQSFFERMPADTGMTFVVVTHLSPNHESLLADILQRTTPMPVVQVEGRVRVEENTVYVIPPSKHLCMMNGHLELEEMERELGRRVVVDLFFRTLADTHGPHAIGVVLSGADGDGAIGLKRIKERGGLTIAQDPGEAEQEGMPRSAIATGMIDWVLPVAQMPERIREYCRNENRLRLPQERGPFGADRPVPPAEGAQKDGESFLHEILLFLRMRTGRDFTCYKRATILRRIGRRMQVNGLAEMEEYLSFLRTHPGEAPALLQDLLISVTNFFRDRKAFEALAEEVPGLFGDKRAGDQVRVWTAGCATGEEAYSVAMLLSEHADTLDSPPSIQIFATDLDGNALAQARAGIYTEAIAADVSEERIRRFFTRENGQLKVRTELRERVLFSVHDLFCDPPFSRLDLITCRNLFIYVNREMQRRAFNIFHFSLRGAGRLFLGMAESADEAETLFHPVSKRHRIYGRIPVRRTSPPAMSARPVLLPGPSGFQAAPRGGAGGPTQAERGQEKGTGSAPGWRDVHFELLDGIAPASVLVNTDHRVMHLSGSAGEWLKVQTGEPTNDLLEMTPSALRTHLRAALFRVAQDGGTVEMRGLPAEDPGNGAEKRTVRLRVRASPRTPGFLLVVFERESREGSVEPPPLPGTRIYTAEERWTMNQLEGALEATRRRLRELEEEHEASLEELKAGNEELQSMNEELRSAGEELETGREEVQSVNEELQTVNQELKSRVEDLGRANSDLQNLMAATDIATVFLDRELRIQRWTPAAMALFNFIPSDMGRPLSDLSHRLDYPDIDADAHRVLERLVPVEHELRAQDRWYLGKLQPYRTVDDRIAGVALTFVDITASKKAEEALRASKERLRLIFENARDYAIYSMDTERRVTSWNTGAERLLGFMEAEILGHSADVIFTPEDRAAGAPQQEARTALTEGRAADERWHTRRDGTRFWGSGVMMAMRDAGGGGGTMGLIKILRDQTAERQAFEEVETARAQAEAAGQAKDRFLAMLSHELRTPLTPVSLALGMLMEEGAELPDRLRGNLEMMARNVALEIRLIDDLLDMTHIVRGRFDIERAPLCVHEAVRKALEICQADFEKKSLKVEVSLDAPHHRLEGDFMRLQQVFWNLLKNAAKFTPRGGLLRILSRNEPGMVVVEVHDTGIGMGPEVLGKIFGAFTQADSSIAPKHGGLGLGLAISRAAVAAHGGIISARSDGPGKGSVFTVVLPLEGPPANHS